MHVNLSQGSEVQGFPSPALFSCLTPLGGNTQFPQHPLGNVATFSTFLLLLVSLLPDLGLFLAPITPLPESQNPICSTADINSTVTQGTAHGLHFVLCRPSLATIEYISSKE